MSYRDAQRRACRAALVAGDAYEIAIDGGTLTARRTDGLLPFVVIDPGGLHFACKSAAEASRVFVRQRDARNYATNERMARLNAWTAARNYEFFMSLGCASCVDGAR